MATGMSREENAPSKAGQSEGELELEADVVDSCALRTFPVMLGSLRAEEATGTVPMLFHSWPSGGSGEPR